MKSIKLKKFFKIIIIAICALSTSCGNLKNSFVKDNFCFGTKIFNKNLGISASLFGDLKTENGSKKNKKRIYKLLKAYSFLHDANILNYSRTIANPHYEIILLYSTKKDSFNQGLIVDDSLKNILIFKKGNSLKNVYLLIRAC